MKAGIEEKSEELQGVTACTVREQTTTRKKLGEEWKGLVGERMLKEQKVSGEGAGRAGVESCPSALCKSM